MNTDLITVPDIMLQTLFCANRFSSVSFGDSASLDSVDELVAALEKHEITYELAAYVHMANVIRVCPLARAFPSAMELNNPFHGYVYWYLVLDFLCYCVTNYSFRVPGLSTTDAVGGGLSSFAKVCKLARRRLKWWRQCKPEASLFPT
jgi:hypothetical protein